MTLYMISHETLIGYMIYSLIIGWILGVVTIRAGQVWKARVSAK